MSGASERSETWGRPPIISRFPANSSTPAFSSSATATNTSGPRSKAMTSPIGWSFTRRARTALCSSGASARQGQIPPVRAAISAAQTTGL